MRCPYCTNSIIVPEELRGGPGFNAAAHSLPEQLAKLAELGRLIGAGNKIGAIKLYRETFGSGLKEAKDAVESLAAGRPVEVARTFEMGGNVMLNPQQMLNWPQPVAQPAARSTSSSTGVWIWVSIIVVAVTVTVLIIVGNFISASLRAGLKDSKSGGARSGSRNGATSSGFASVMLNFGSEGIGAGQFKDARSIAVDGKGRIYVGEYTGGRVQVFDAEGTFITQWMVDLKMPLLQLAADRQGTVYVVQGGTISRYKGTTGQPLGKMSNAPEGGFIGDMALAMDGGMVIVQHGEDIVRLNSSGRVVQTIKAAISTQSGDSELSTRVGVDGLGNIYAMGRFNNAVFKFGPNGKYLTRFGGEGDQPGQFRALDAIAVDGQGRVYVADIKGVQVFDNNGRYIDTFKLEQDAPFGMIFNDRNELFIAARKQVYKFAINKP